MKTHYNSQPPFQLDMDQGVSYSSESKAIVERSRAKSYSE